MYNLRRRHSNTARKKTKLVVWQVKNGVYRYIHIEEGTITNIPFCHFCVCVLVKTGERARPFLTHGTVPDECANRPRDDNKLSTGQFHCKTGVLQCKHAMGLFQ